MFMRLLGWLLFLALVASGVTAFYLRAQQDQRPQLGRRVPLVRVVRPTVRGLLVHLAYPATLAAIQAADIRAIEAKGFVRRITVDKGDRVSKGQVLVTIDCPEYHARARQAAQGVASAKAMRDNARRVALRLRPMRAQAFVSQLELDAAEAALDTAQARLQNEEAKVAESQNLLGYCVIRSPFDGEVAMRFVDVGEQVRPGGRTLLQLVRRDAMRVLVTVIDKDGEHLREGLPAELTVQGLPGQTFFGKVTRFSRTVDPATRTLQVEVELPNPSGVLRPNMSGRVHLSVMRFPHATLLPATALLATDAGTFVFVVREGVAVRVPVKLGHDMGDEVQVLEGLQSRDQVVVVGRDVLSEGAPVEIAAGADPAIGAPPATP